MPKAIVYRLVNYVQKKLQTELITQLYQRDLFKELLIESADISQERKDAKGMLKALQSANDIIGEIRETQIR